MSCPSVIAASLMYPNMLWSRKIKLSQDIYYYVTPNQIAVKLSTCDASLRADPTELQPCDILPKKKILCVLKLTFASTTNITTYAMAGS